MKVEVSYNKLGIATYHIYDNDNREICCHEIDAVELLYLLLKLLLEE